MKALMVMVLLMCMWPSAYCVDGTSDSDAGSKIVALENLWNQAAEAKDVVALDRILDDAFVYVDPDGRLLTKTEVLADVKASHGLRFALESMVVHLHGEIAVVTGIYKVEGVERGKPFVRRDRFVDTWRYKNGYWVSIASLATPIAF
jgi:ketosteroid isomerase-like protein